MSLEREAFEKEFKAKWGIGHHILGMVRFIEESQDYAPIKAVKQMSDEYYWVLALNTGWWAWQASTQRDGFKFVPVDDLDTLCMYGYNYGSEYDIDDLLDCVGRCKAMIEVV